MIKWLKQTLSKVDKTLLFLTFAFLVFGLIMIQSASSMESYMRYGNSPYYYFFKQLFFVSVGLGISIIIILFPTKFYLKNEKLILFGMISLLVLTQLFGTIKNGARSWLNIGFIGLQPSEFIKVGLIVYIASYFENKHKKMDNQITAIFPLIITMLLSAMVVIQPDLGTGIIVTSIGIILFYTAPINKEQRGIITKIFVGGIAIITMIFIITGGSFLRDYQKERFKFTDPCDRYQEESGYQLCNSYIAFYNGGITGQGLGESTQKYLYLPESYTDFIFPIIVEEWGLIVGIVILICYLIILWRIFFISKKATSIRNALIAYGVFIYILLHITINLVGVMGIGPLTGVPIPFLSYGGSYALSLTIALALVQRVAIENKIVTEKIKKK